MQRMNNFWVDASFGDETNIKSLSQSLKNCWHLHSWLVANLNSQLKDNLHTVNYMEFRDEIYKFIYQKELLKDSQKHSLLRAAEKTFSWFSDQPKFDAEMRIIDVDPIPISQYNELEIKSRKAWIRYLVDERPLTTFYGTIFLEGNWQEVLKQQAEELRIENSKYYLLYLMNSITVKLDKEKKTIKIKLNTYFPYSKRGTKARKIADQNA